MPGLPTVQVLLDDGTRTFPYDITTYARMPEGINGARGRGNEMDGVTPATINVVLDNTDGRFTLGSTIIASPSPIRIDNEIRIKFTANATTVDRYTGSLKAAPVSWPGGGDEFALVKCTLVDQQAKLERRPLLSMIREEVALDSPMAYYTLGEPTGALSAADSSINQAAIMSQDGSGAAVVFGSGTGLPTDGLTAATFAGGKYLTGDVTRAAPGGNLTLEAWFVTTATSGGIVSFVRNGAGSGLTVDSGAIFPGIGGPVINDGLLHHAVVTYDAALNLVLYIDGVSVATSFATAPDGQLRIGFGGIGPAFSFTGTIAHVGVYNYVLSAARVAAHYQAGKTGFAGESGTSRITRLAGYVGAPVGTLDTSLTNVASIDITGKSASEAISEVAKAEYGIAFVNGSGNLTFHNRNRPISLTAPTMTIDANYLDEGTQFEVDMQGAINYFETTAAGTSVKQIAQNLTSEVTNKHGRYPASETYLVQTDAEALDRANWNVGMKGEPLQRVGALKLDVLSMPAAMQAQILALEPNAWLRITGLPGQTPGGTTADLAIQGWGPETCKKDEWSISFNVVTRALFTAWILGDSTYSVLGSTTRLYI